MAIKMGAMLKVWLSPNGILTAGLSGAVPPTAATDGTADVAADGLAAAELAGAAALAEAGPALAEAGPEAAATLAAAGLLAGADGGAGLLAAGAAASPPQAVNIPIKTHIRAV